MTDATSIDLRRDFLEEDADMMYRYIQMFGIESYKPLSNTDELKCVLSDFLNSKESVVKCAFIRICDDRDQYFFVPQEQSPSVCELMKHWGLGASTVTEVRDYHKLHLAMLEYVRDWL